MDASVGPPSPPLPPAPTSDRRRTVAPVVAAIGVLSVVVLVAAANCKPTGGGGTTTSTTRPKATTTTTRSGCATAGLPTTVAYRTIAGVPANAVSLDVHAPSGACKAPVVIWVHGGGYQVGDKANQMADKVLLFNAKGWILVSVNYRLTVAGDPGSAHFPDHYQDVAAAVGWVHRTIARYGGDPNRVALLGHSAGADIVANVADQPTYLAAQGLTPSALRCAGPLDTEGFDKVASVGDGDSAQWDTALGNNPNYETDTSATRFTTTASDLPDTIGVVRGSAIRQQIEQAYLAKVAATGAKAVTVDARSLSHEEVNTRIGAPGDTVMTPPLMAFLTTCFA